MTQAGTKPFRWRMAANRHCIIAWAFALSGLAAARIDLSKRCKIAAGHERGVAAARMQPEVMPSIVEQLLKQVTQQGLQSAQTHTKARGANKSRGLGTHEG